MAQGKLRNSVAWPLPSKRPWVPCASPVSPQVIAPKVVLPRFAPKKQHWKQLSQSVAQGPQPPQGEADHGQTLSEAASSCEFVVTAAVAAPEVAPEMAPEAPDDPDDCGGGGIVAFRSTVLSWKSFESMDVCAFCTRPGVFLCPQCEMVVCDNHAEDMHTCDTTCANPKDLHSCDYPACFQWEAQGDPAGA